MLWLPPGFAVASISKTVCGTAIMRLHDQGKLNVEGRVQDYLPDFALADANAARDLKIWHLLTHTPGFEGQLDTPDRGSETSAHFVETLRYLPQLARPGQVWSYNNAGWGVAGRVVRAESSVVVLVRRCGLGDQHSNNRALVCVCRANARWRQ